jgi:hypothetical protein
MTYDQKAFNPKKLFFKTHADILGSGGPTTGDS